MSLALLSPWQQLLWLVCVVVLIVPVVSAGVVSIIHGYFNEKEQHAGRMAKALVNVISQIAGELNKKVDEVLEKIKNGEGLNEVKKE